MSASRSSAVWRGYRGAFPRPFTIGAGNAEDVSLGVGDCARALTNSGRREPETQRTGGERVWNRDKVGGPTVAGSKRRDGRRRKFFEILRQRAAAAASINGQRNRLREWIRLPRWRSNLQPFASQPVDQARHVTRAEAVVDVHHRHVAGATVQHAQQRRQAVEAKLRACHRGAGRGGRCGSRLSNALVISYSQMNRTNTAESNIVARAPDQCASGPPGPLNLDTGIRVCRLLD